MYQKYHTEALVLGSRESGEADRAVTLYTRDFGLVRTRGTGLRSEHSKMRYAIQNYGQAYVSLIKGKRGWRLAGATALRGAQGSVKGMAAFARISELVMRLVAGEDHNEYLFTALAEAHQALMQDEDGAVATIEIICVARILYALGYISTEAMETALFTHTAYTADYIAEADTMREKLLASINRAISETHL